MASSALARSALRPCRHRRHRPVLDALWRRQPHYSAAAGTSGRHGHAACHDRLFDCRYRSARHGLYRRRARRNGARACRPRAPQVWRVLCRGGLSGHRSVPGHSAHELHGLRDAGAAAARGRFARHGSPGVCHRVLRRRVCAYAASGRHHARARSHYGPRAHCAHRAGCGCRRDLAAGSRCRAAGSLQCRCRRAGLFDRLSDHGPARVARLRHHHRRDHPRAGRYR